MTFEQRDGISEREHQHRNRWISATAVRAGISDADDFSYQHLFRSKRSKKTACGLPGEAPDWRVMHDEVDCPRCREVIPAGKLKPYVPLAP